MQVITHGKYLIELVSETDDDYRLLQRLWVHGIEIVQHENSTIYQSITIREKVDDV